MRPFAEPKLDVRDVQGNVLRGYGFPFAAYLWLHVDDAAAGRKWLGKVVPQVTTAEPWRSGKPATTLNVALTFAGLQALDVPDVLLDSFPLEFRDGMAMRADELRDAGEDHPDNWDPGFGTGEASILVTVNAQEEAALDAVVAELRGELEGTPVSVLHLERAAVLFGNREHFGFSDGFAQPAVVGDGNVAKPGDGKPERDGRWEDLALGEFILGYEDEDEQLPQAPRGPLGRNGTYMVYRKLHQHVAAFRRALRERSASFPGGEEALAAKIVGRWRDGTPVILSPDSYGHQRHLTPERINDFRYEDDPDGRLCPLGAHIRRVNPRDALGWHATRSRRHRMIRRGMPYGPPAPDGEDDDGQDRGLIFVSLGSSIRRQFEIVQGQWCADGNIFGLGDDKDWIVLADDRPAAKMTIQGDKPRFVVGQPRFVTVRAGEYLLVPSIAGLRELSG
jgi:Dyp-type peroxidase family